MRTSLKMRSMPLADAGFSADDRVEHHAAAGSQAAREAAVDSRGDAVDWRAESSRTLSLCDGRSEVWPFEQDDVGLPAHGARPRSSGRRTTLTVRRPRLFATA